MKQVILEKSNQKNKKYKVTMTGFPNMKPHSHHFSSRNGITYVNGATDKQKSAWEARHKKDKGYNNIHSGIYHSKALLWNTKNLKTNIELLSKKLDAKFIVKL